MRKRSRLLLAIGLLLLPGALPAGAASPVAGSAVFEGPVPQAHCGPGSSPETAKQGEVTLNDRTSGRSQLGYRCNLKLVGQHQGEGAGWQNAWYGHCDYYDTKTASDPALIPNGNGNGQKSPGTQVLDVSDPAHPKLTANLDTPALDGAWESLKVNQPRGLLAGVGGFGVDASGPLYFDVYDVKADCAHPKLLASVPIDMPTGHEGNWSTDGMTYYGSSLGAGTVAAIDVKDPAAPSLITVARVGNVVHGVSTSDDGNLLYVADIAASTPDTAGNVNGLEIYDVSSIQARSTPALATKVGSVYWADGSTAQHPIPIHFGGKAYVLFVDEGGAGAARIIDVQDPTAPRVVSKLKLEIHMPDAASLRSAETAGNGSFGYEGHYCAVDSPHDPTAVACGYFQSGIRVFDIRDPLAPREIAYYNPAAQVAKHGTLPGSEHDGGANNSQPSNLTADWCASQIRFYTAADGSHELWAQCQDNGFMALAFTNGAYPLKSALGTGTRLPAAASPVAVKVAEPSSPSDNHQPGALAATGLGLELPSIAAILLVLCATLLRRTRRSSVSSHA